MGLGGDNDDEPAFVEDPLEARLSAVCVFNVFCSSLFLFFPRALPVAYEGSQVRGQIGAAAAGLHHSHSNTGSNLRL